MKRAIKAADLTAIGTLEWAAPGDEARPLVVSRLPGAFKGATVGDGEGEGA